MKLSIIVPVYNEEKTIGHVLRALEDVVLHDVQKQVIVINDGSTDATALHIQAFKRKHAHVSVLTHQRNLGKGMAVRTGIASSSGDYVLIQDADLEYRPQDIQKLLLPITEGKAQVVYGTRLKRLPNFQRDERTLQFFLHYVGNIFLSFVTSILYGQYITDMEIGYKVFPRRMKRSFVLHAKGFEFEPELTAKILKMHYRIYEVPISTNPRSYREGKKLHTFRDGFKALWTLFKYRFVD